MDLVDALPSYLFKINFQALLQNCENLLLASSCLSVCPSVRLSVCMQQLRSHWKNFQETFYLNIFRKSAQKIKDSLKFDTNNRYFDEEQ